MTTVDLARLDPLESSCDPVALEARHGAHNYHPLPVTIVSGEGAWVTDDHGRRLIDLLSAYSALNFGHAHPALLAAAHCQLDRLTLTSRAFHNDQLGPFCAELAALCPIPDSGVLPMNTGAEAVETAIKAARRWGYLRNGVPADRANIVTFAGNFHGRTTTIIGFSTDPATRDTFGPYSGGFRTATFGDLGSVEAVIDEHTVAVLVEPIQGEAGVVIPPAGFMASLRRLCDERGMLLICDEIQSGLGRTGRTFAVDHEGPGGLVPDILILGKALGGGIIPLSAIVARRDVIDVFTPGTHGSTFGGNPLACAVGRTVIGMLMTGEHQANAARLGAHLDARLAAMHGRGVVAHRCRGLWAGVDIDPSLGSGREICERLLARGILAKDTHGSTVRIAPPLVIADADLDVALDQLTAVLAG